MTQKTLLCFGYGASAAALAKILLPLGWRVIGTTRDADKIKTCDAELHLWGETDLAPLIAESSHILSSIAPSESGDLVLANYTKALTAKQFDWVGYLSTTGVYGDHQGGWVDETTPPNPKTTRGKWRVTAESDWQDLDISAHIFRLAGIYGTGRGPFEKLRRGTARRIVKKNQVFSRIHLEDIAQVLFASIQRPNPQGAIYNVCDDCPAPPEDVIAYAAKLLGLPVPKAIAFEDAELGDMARSFYSESKRVRNDLIKTELGVGLLYPDYKSGLHAILNDE